MFQKKITERVLEAIEHSPKGIASLDVLASLRICGRDTLKTTLSRLGMTNRLIHLKRGTYSVNPLRDAFSCAQSTFNGYLGFTSALYLHKLITEIPFSITVVTNHVSKGKLVGEFSFLAVALNEKAVGFEKLGDYVVSSRAKTLFDCLYLPKYSIEQTKLIASYKEAKLGKTEWKDFDGYVKKFAGGKKEKMLLVKREILGG
ncbi:MAG: hypothetical protein AABX01_02510 [Candidatus Micrarchaeota archaeon]